MRPVTPPLALSARGQADLDYLRRKLGAGRVSGPELDNDGDWQVELVRADGKKTWFYERSPDHVLARARAAVERPPQNRRTA